jgi:hypothetical protein
MTNDPIPRANPNIIRTMSLTAGVVSAVACGEVTGPTPVAEQEALPLDSASTAAIQVVLGDVPLRLGDAFGEAQEGRWFATLIDSMGFRIARGEFDTARWLGQQARLALADAAKFDPRGVGDADRTAILLALDETTKQLTTSRLRARGFR